MFPVIINDGQTPFPDDDIFYIVAKEGIFLRKKLGVMVSIAPVKNISILESVQTSAQMNIKKIPAKTAQQIINFFKAVYKEHYAEAIVLLFYNLEEKKYKVVCPVQEVSGGAADYSKAITIDGYDMIGTIHSHAGMSAFHSGVDDDDEKSFDGLHITFGNMNDDDISVSASIVANGHRVMVKPEDYINNFIRTVDINETVKVPYASTYKWDKDKKKMVPIKTNKFYNKHKFDQRYQVKLARDPGFPADWMKKVSKKSYVYARGGAGGNWYDGWYGHGSYYDPKYWRGWQGHGVQQTGKQKNIPGVSVGTSGALVPAKTPTKVSDITKKTKPSPCDDCNFKNHKINMMLDSLDDKKKKAILAWAIEELEGQTKDKLAESVDAEELSYYYCFGCSESFSFDESGDTAACCPNCNTDEHLIEIEASDMLTDDPDTYEEEKSSSMLKCPECASSFTKEFLNDGMCPICGAKVLDETYTKAPDGHIQCPDCGSFELLDTLILDNRCSGCGYDFPPFEISTAINEEALNSAQAMSDQGEEQLRKDAGMYMDMENDPVSTKEAMEAAAEADKHMEKIPTPDQNSTPLNGTKRIPGGFFDFFFRRSKKK